MTEQTAQLVDLYHWNDEKLSDKPEITCVLAPWAGLQHKSITAVLGAAVDGPTAYIFTEPIHCNLDMYLKELGRPLTLGEVQRLCRQVLEGLCGSGSPLRLPARISPDTVWITIENDVPTFKLLCVDCGILRGGDTSTDSAGVVPRFVQSVLAPIVLDDLIPSSGDHVDDLVTRISQLVPMLRKLGALGLADLFERVSAGDSSALSPQQARQILLRLPFKVTLLCCLILSFMLAMSYRCCPCWQFCVLCLGGSNRSNACRPIKPTIQQPARLTDSAVCCGSSIASCWNSICFTNRRDMLEHPRPSADFAAGFAASVHCITRASWHLASGDVTFHARQA